MSIDPVSATSARRIWAVHPTGQAQAGATDRDTPADPRPPRVATPAVRRVEVTFHDDLRILITRLLDDRTGEVVSEVPARQVLDLVADLMKTMRTREEI